jgi:hypothetical protein
MLEDLERRRLIDEVGNGWFIRNLLDKATQARDLRVLTTTINPGLADLVTIRSADLQRAFGELTS